MQLLTNRFSRIVPALITAALLLTPSAAHAIQTGTTQPAHTLNQQLHTTQPTSDDASLWDTEAALRAYSGANAPLSDEGNSASRTSASERILFLDFCERNADMCKAEAAELTPDSRIAADTTVPAENSVPADQSDEYTEQKAVGTMQCPAGYTFYQEPRFWGTTINYYPGVCKPNTPQRSLTGIADANTNTDPQQATLMEEEAPAPDSENHAEADSAAEASPSATLTEALFVPEAEPAFDLDPTCVTVLNDLSDHGTSTEQWCDSDLTASNVGSDPTLPMIETPSYVVVAAPDTDISLSACVLTHPEEVRGDATQCDAPSHGAANTSMAYATAPGLQPAHSESATQSVTGSFSVYVNGEPVSEEIPFTDGLANVALAGLPEGLHQATLIFLPDNAQSPQTMLNVIIDATTANDQLVGESDGSEFTNTAPMQVTLGVLFLVALCIAVWLIIGGRFSKPQINK